VGISSRPPRREAQGLAQGSPAWFCREARDAARQDREPDDLAAPSPASKG